MNRLGFFALFRLLPTAALLWGWGTPPCAAMIPRVCKDNLTLHDAVCCPIPPGHSEPCGGPGVGVCLEFQVHKEYGEQFYTKLLWRDDRIHWPRRLFRYGCHCDNNYWGFACHECFYGWTGRRCRRRKISVRRNIMSYTAEEKRLFQKVMVKSHHEESDEYVIFEDRDWRTSDPLVRPRFLRATLHQMLVFIHRYTSRSTMFPSRRACARSMHFDFNHGGVGFVTWHRFFMLFWERQAARLARRHFGVEDFRFPYWDWTDARKCEVCTPDLVGDLSDPRHPNRTSPFRRWREYCGESSRSRCNACHTRLMYERAWPPLRRGWDPHFHFPTSSQVQFTLSRPVYYAIHGGKGCESFAHALEGDCAAADERSEFVMHNGVHNAVDGPFSGAAGSTNDPLFPLHHLQIDRVFAAWFRRHQPHPRAMPNRGMKAGHCRDCNLVGIFPPLRHAELIVDTRALGYEYDSLEFGARRRPRY